MKLGLLLAFFSLFFSPFTSNAQIISGIVNDYTPVLGFFDCDKTLLQVGSTAGFSAGDKVLIIQMQGATVNTSNTANFGDITNAGNAGNFELNRIESISGNQIRLQYKLQKAYFAPGGKVQLVRVPEYDNVVANALTCKAWDGTTGGVLVLDVANTLTLQGNLDVSEKGFRGGTVQDADVLLYHETDYFYSPDPALAGAKGEGIAIIPTNLSYGRGKVANGGGGGNAHNAGGGGGGNAGAGGNGGLEYWFTPNSPTPGTDGIGGLNVFETAVERIAMGGGGGAGHTNDNVGTSGGNGGGIIILKANNIVAEGSNVVVAANGGNVVTTGDGNNDGQGGGGAGGSILIQANQVAGTLNCELKGGRGGDCLFYVQNQIIGPGGGGGGGKLLLSQNFPNVTANLDGGINGIANQNQTNGAQPGQSGVKLLNVSILEGTIPSGIVNIEQNISFCPGSSVFIGNIEYDQPGTVKDTIVATAGGCDTVLTYHLQYSPTDLVFDIENVFCQNGSIKLNYSICNLGSGPLPNEVRVLFTTVNPTVEMATTSAILKFDIANPDTCQTGSVTISGLPVSDILYSVVNFDGSLPTPFSFDDFPVTNIEECNYTNNLDSILFQLPSPPMLDLGPDVVLCVDSTVVFDAGAGFFSYLWQDGSTGQTFATSAPAYFWVEVTDSCGFKQRDTVLLTISLLPDTQFPDTALCAGESISLSLPGFDFYAWSPAAGLSCTDCADVTISPSATTTYTLLATTDDGCILKDTFLVEVRPLPTFSKTIEFCNGDTVFIGGAPYSQPGTVVLTLSASVGCDTIATYILKYLDDPSASVSISCPDNIAINSPPGTGPIVVNYALPTFISNCPCPGVALTLTQGLPPGSAFPVATTKVCYEAKDSCGNTAACCFNVTVSEEQPCDVKQTACVKYELLGITRNASTSNLTYQIRVTNTCANKMIYTAFQVPNGMVAVAPANNSIFTAPSGRDYDVRNPNYSPFYSIRFKSKADSIAGGQSDIFEYTLPPLINPTYIHATSRLYPQQFFEVYLNTFYCPIEVVGDKAEAREDLTSFEKSPNLNVFPNPTDGTLFADLSDWEGEQIQVQIFDAQGQRVQQIALIASDLPQEIQLPNGLPNGLYFLEILPQNGEKRSARFVLRH